jgi:hypothetical protein
MSPKTVVELWNRRWATDAGRADYLEPHPEVTALLPELKLQIGGLVIGADTLFTDRTRWSLHSCSRGSRFGAAVL